MANQSSDMFRPELMAILRELWSFFWHVRLMLQLTWQEFYIRLKLLLCRLYVTILKISIVAKTGQNAVKIHFKIILNCCWCNFGSKHLQAKQILETNKRRLVVTLRYSFIPWTQGNGHMITELTSFEERSKRGCLDATITSTAN